VQDFLEARMPFRSANQPCQSTESFTITLPST